MPCLTHHLSSPTPGFSASISADARIIAFGGPYDNSSVGAVWIFEFDGQSYQQVGGKLVGETSGDLYDLFPLIGEGKDLYLGRLGGNEVK